MKLRPVRICDVSRTLRLSSASLIEFLQEKGFRIIGEYLSPLSSRMVELIQNGFREGPPFTELNSHLLQAERWEKENAEFMEMLHTPPPPPPKVERQVREYKPRQRRAVGISFAPPPVPVATGRLPVTPLDLELIQHALGLDEERKNRVAEYLRRKTILKAISKMEEK